MDAPIVSHHSDHLMERLRARAGSLRSLTDLAKSLRLALLDKRQGIDALDRSQLHGCLQLMQDKVRLHSVHGTLDRVDGVARQLGCTCTASADGRGCVIECAGACCVRLEFDADSAAVTRVHVQHQSEPAAVESPLIASALAAGDYAAFRAHLQGLLDIYSVATAEATDTADVRTRVYTTLCAIETDVNALMNRDIRAVVEPTHYRDFALVRRRCGGRPMRVVFLLPPRELLDTATYQQLSVSMERVMAGDGLGYWFEVSVVDDPNGLSHSVPLHPLYNGSGGQATGSGDDGSISTLSFTNLTPSNSCRLPIVYQLRFRRALPFDMTAVKALNALTGVAGNGDTARDLTADILDGTRSVHQPLLVRLPDQWHRYHIGSESQMYGVMLEKLMFTHASQIVSIMMTVRRQSLLSTLIRSFVRAVPKKQPSSTAVVNFEVVACLKSGLTISFENPEEDWLSTLEVELSDSSPGMLVCRLHTPSKSTVDEMSTKILRETLSVPVMMRALLRRLTPAASIDANRGESSVPGVPSQNGEVRIKSEPSDTHSADVSVNEHEFMQPQKYSAPGDSSDFVMTTPVDYVSTQSSVVKVKTEPNLSVVEDVSMDTPEKTACSELDSIEATVRQIELDKAQAINAAKVSSQTNQMPSFDIFGFPSGTGPNLPSSLTITPIPNKTPEERRKERKDKERDRGDKRRRREDSPSSRSNRGGDSRGSPSNKDRDHMRESCNKLASSKTSSASPPLKKHPLSSSSSPGFKSSGSSVSKHKTSSSSKHSSHSNSPDHSVSRHPSPSSHRSSGSSTSSSASRALEKLKDKSKQHRPKLDRVESNLISSGSMSSGRPVTTSSNQATPETSALSTESWSPNRSRKSSLSDVINKLNTLVSNEDVKKEDGVKGDKSEFTVKPSTDGMKLTINKTKSRSSSSSPSGIRQSQSERTSPFSCAKNIAGMAGGVRKALYRSDDGAAEIASDAAQCSVVSQSTDDLQLLAKSCRQDVFGASERSDIVLDSDLPPLPKSLEIKKIDRVASPSTTSSSSSLDVHRSSLSITEGGVHRTSTATAISAAASSCAQSYLSSVSSANVPSARDSTVCRPGLPSSVAATSVSCTSSSSSVSVTSTATSGIQSAVPPPPPPPPPPPQFPASPSVQIHIVRSPAPVASPRQLSLVSPRSSTGQSSPCIIDDDLMDEALLGLGSK